MGIYLECGLCGRKQADGLLSRAAWGHLDVGGRPLQACRACKELHHDWADRLRALLSPAPGLTQQDASA
jgi:hypothetical protein